MQNLITRLRERARIRRQIPTRKSVQEGAPDRIADLLEEAANEIERLHMDDEERYNFQITQPNLLYYKIVLCPHNSSKRVHSVYENTQEGFDDCKTTLNNLREYYGTNNVILVEPKSE